MVVAGAVCFCVLTRPPRPPRPLSFPGRNVQELLKLKFVGAITTEYERFRHGVTLRTVAICDDNAKQQKVILLLLLLLLFVVLQCSAVQCGAV